MRYCRLFALFLLCFCVTSCFPKRKMVRLVEKEKRFEKKIERREIRRALKAYKKEYHAWHKIQSPETQKRLKKQKKETNKFYKPYGKGCTEDMPGKYHRPRNKYRKNGIK